MFIFKNHFIYKATYLLIFTLIISSSYAQSPKKISYQAVIRDTNNNLVANRNISMQISILQGTGTGPTVYVETQTTNTNSNGLASIKIGGGTIVSGNFSTIDWANGEYFVKTETDPNGAIGGIHYTIIDTSQLLSVPYAFYADKAGSITSEGDYSHFIGEYYGGGVIFHLWKDTLGIEHGLIVALNDQSTSITWSNLTYTLIGPSAQNFSDGLSNSNAIVAQSGHIYSAAKLCLDLVSGGKSDWYLPSIYELNELNFNLFTVLKALSQISGATQIDNVHYWSSTEYLYNYAYLVHLGFGEKSVDYKYDEASVRAIRAF